MLGLPTWLVVLIGLLLNISSALVTHFIIEGKDQQLNILSAQAARNNKEIDLFWVQIEGMERKRETLYLLLNQGDLQPNVALQFSRLLKTYLHQEISVAMLANIEQLDFKINNYQDDLREKIDAKYFLNLGLAELEMVLKKQISRLRNWSIFLQMIGLSLILARDLSRKRRD
ncbi:hypothetical protein CXF72_08125 [Psychromonas sp. MB-3u-54]|uniref:hypothetical protein n=1 Tax=Psychromonas sp. MB-3u-54 TaxID=2058319 RepID=UPI000C33B36C|nr:hypothetical protein [Psychromonas sp. MB-3u-54]PKH03141.1 hypothetical protein CXF72_08125 [Psychromonas sp. MB-3u-54]